MGKIHVETIEKSLLAQGLLTQQTPMIKGGKLVGLPRVKNIKQPILNNGYISGNAAHSSRRRDSSYHQLIQTQLHPTQQRQNNISPKFLAENESEQIINLQVTSNRKQNERVNQNVDVDGHRLNNTSQNSMMKVLDSNLDLDQGGNNNINNDLTNDYDASEPIVTVEANYMREMMRRTDSLLQQEANISPDSASRNSHLKKYQTAVANRAAKRKSPRQHYPQRHSLLDQEQ